MISLSEIYPINNQRVEQRFQFTIIYNSEKSERKKTYKKKMVSKLWFLFMIEYLAIKNIYEEMISHEKQFTELC